MEEVVTRVVEPDDLDIARARFPVGKHIRGRVSRLLKPGAVGLFVDLGQEPGGFVDVLWLPYEPGFSAAMTLSPFTPCHTPTLNGMPTADPHVSFCVEKPLIEQCAKTLGNDAGNPKQSGTMKSTPAFPNSFRKK